MGADDIGLDEEFRSGNGSVHMRLGGEMHQSVKLLLNQQFLDRCGVADVSVNESQFRAGLDGFEICQIPRICQRIEDHQPASGMLLEPIMYEIRADEAAATGNQ